MSVYERLFPAYEIRTSGDAAILVMATDPLYACPWFLLARDLKRGGVRHLYYGPTEGRPNPRMVYPWMREVDFVAPSVYVKRKLEEVGLRVVDVVYHGVDLEDVVKARSAGSFALEYFKKYGLDPSKHVVVTTIANSHPRKGLAWYDRVVEEVGKRDGSVKFLVITEDKGLTYFRKRPNLVVTADFGKLPRVTILSVIANSHVLAIPSLAEGFGLPVLEAMALGTPVVHAELPPLMEFSTGFTVRVVDVVEYDRAEVGPSGIIFEHHLWEPTEFAEVLLQVVDLLRNRREAIVDWRALSWERVRYFSIYRTYPRLLRYFADGVPEELDDGVAAYDFRDLPEVPPPAPPLQQLEVVEEPRVGEVVEVGAEVVGVDVGELVVGSLERVGPGKLTKPFHFPGGDWFIKDEIIELLTRSGCKTLVEVFGGSGVVSMYAPRDVFKNVVYNDKDSLLTNFFTVLRDRPKELVAKLSLLPVSRELFERYRRMAETGEIAKLDPVERAAATFYLLRCSMFGTGKGFAVDVSRSVAANLRRQVALLPEYAKMWSDVTIENRDFREVIRVYDRPYVVFYCDPPFLSSRTRNRDDYYRHGFTERDMRDLLDLLSRIRGKFVLKLPEDHLEIPFIREWIESHGYRVKVVEHSKSFRKVVGGGRPRFRTVLVYNYEA